MGRLVALLIIALWQAAISRAPFYLYYDALIALFAVSGLMQVAVSRMGGRWRVSLVVFVLVGAVLFADIVGFTRQCEERPPAEAIDLLRGFHRRMEQTIFAFGGTLDKFLGDGVMATFGTPRSGSRDAANALGCARAMLGEIDAWNCDRRARGQAEVRIEIGVHTGPVVLGDVGSSRHLEFAVIGDTVNIASRLESLTRQLEVTIVISERLAQLTAQQGGGDALVGFSHPFHRRYGGGRIRCPC
jgi:class 3 adenylate cyclase